MADNVIVAVLGVDVAAGQGEDPPTTEQGEDPPPDCDLTNLSSMFRTISLHILYVNPEQDIDSGWCLIFAYFHYLRNTPRYKSLG
jgi:hypothetical protein